MRIRNFPLAMGALALAVLLFFVHHRRHKSKSTQMRTAMSDATSFAEHRALAEFESHMRYTFDQDEPPVVYIDLEGRRISAMKNFFAICFVALAMSSLPGCGVLYSVTVNDRSVMNQVQLEDGGVPVRVKLFGCDRNPATVLIDSDKQLWLYCNGYYQGAYSKLVKAGPEPSLLDYDSRSTPTGQIDKLRRAMTVIPLKSCGQNRWCGSYAPQAYTNLTLTNNFVEGDSYLEYVSYAKVMAAGEVYYLALRGDSASPAVEPSAMFRRFFDETRAAAEIAHVPNKAALARARSLAAKFGLERAALQTAFDNRYFELDYADAFQAATTREQLQRFIALYKVYNPSGLVEKAQVKLVEIYRNEKTAIGSANAFALTKAKADFDDLQARAKKPAEMSLLADAVFSTAHNKEKFFDVRASFQRHDIKTTETQNMGVFSNYSFFGERKFTATGNISPARGSPLLHSQRRYKLTLTAEISVPRTRQVRSGILGDSDKADDYSTTSDIDLILLPPYKSSFNINFGDIRLVYFDRGSRGGFTAVWPTSDPAMTIRVKSIEPLND